MGSAIVHNNANNVGVFSDYDEEEEKNEGDEGIKMVQ